MQNNTNRALVLSPIAYAIAIIGLLGLSGATHAQEATKSDKGELQTLTVTANKRVEKLENVPSSVAVLTEESLERNNVKDLSGITNLIPSLSITNAPSTAFLNGINLRGIGTASFSIAVSPDVAVIIDDIPIGFQSKAFQDLADISRVEVLRGPQSTLFGRSALAGAINIVTKPITNKLGGAFSASYSSDNERRARISYGGKLNNEFGLRIALSDNDYPGNVENLQLGKHVNGTNSKAAMLKLSWQPSEKLYFDLTPRYNESESTCCAFPVNSLNPAAAYYALIPASQISAAPVGTVLAGITPNAENMKVRTDLESGTNIKSYGTGFRATYDLDNGASLTAISGFEKFKLSEATDQDGTNVPIMSLLQQSVGKLGTVPGGLLQTGRLDGRSVSQEIRYNSEDAGNFRYVMGLWYAKNDLDRFFTRGYNGIPGSNPREYNTQVFNTNKAIFGQANWEFLPSYTVVGGIRFNRETSGYRYAKGLPAPYATSAGFVPTLLLSTANGRFKTPEASDNAVTGKLSLQHQFDPTLMGYAAISTGYKGYAYDVLSSSDLTRASVQPIDPETAINYEIGSKGNFLKNTVTVNATAFYTKVKNFQSTSNVPVIDPITNTEKFFAYLNSSGRVQSKGLELEVAALATKNLLINSAFTYTDAKIVDYEFGDCYKVPGSPNGGFNANCIIKNPLRGGANTSDKAGNPLPQEPKYKLVFGAQYDLPLAQLPFNVFFTGNIRYQSLNYLDLQNPERTLPGYSITNLGVGLKDNSKKYTVTFSVNNVFDKHYSYYDSAQLGTYVAADRITPVASSNWFPARDAFRYFSIRVDVKF